MKKPASHAKCGSTGVRLQGVSIFCRLNAESIRRTTFARESSRGRVEGPGDGRENIIGGASLAFAILQQRQKGCAPSTKAENKKALTEVLRARQQQQ